MRVVPMSLKNYYIEDTAFHCSICPRNSSDGLSLAQHLYRDHGLRICLDFKNGGLTIQVKQRRWPKGIL